MDKIINKIVDLQGLLDKTRQLDFLAPLLLRIFLAPIFIIAGYGKLTALDSTAYYFGEMLGMPAPMFMAVMAGATELLGGIALVLGLATRWFAVPLMMTMIVAAATAHWDNGWHALPESKLTVPWEWRVDLIEQANERKAAVKSLLKEHGNYKWLTEAGYVTILKNGIEFAATYFIMLLALFFIGSGRYVSLDYYIRRKYYPE